MKPESEQTVMTLANVIQLASDIVDESSSAEFTDLVQGSLIAKATTDMLVASHVNVRLSTAQYQIGTRA